jgi:23S rRNA pseudouridine1911/1915/1917 synthase
VDHETKRVFSYEISEEHKDTRLDVFISSRSISLSRSRVKALIENEHVTVNDGPSKAGYKLKLADKVVVCIPPLTAPSLDPEKIDFDVVYEDESLIVLNKPAGVVVHPAPGHAMGTLVHGLIYHCQDLSGIGGGLRPGIVHRLDKDTSGLMVAAKNDPAHESLAKQFKSGTVKKQYDAVVHGLVNGQSGKIDLPIARHLKKRKEMTVAPSRGKRALTQWRKIEQFGTGFSFLEISIKTGRTHQIRVHLSHMGHPVVGDPVYGYGRTWWKRQPSGQLRALTQPKRQMLHARTLGFLHPVQQKYMEFEARLPEDMSELIQELKRLEWGS